MISCACFGSFRHQQHHFRPESSSSPRRVDCFQPRRELRHRGGVGSRQARRSRLHLVRHRRLRADSRLGIGSQRCQRRIHGRAASAAAR